MKNNNSLPDTANLAIEQEANNNVFASTVRLVQKRPNRRIAYLLYYLFDYKDIIHVNLQ